MLFELKDKVAVITGAAGGIASLVVRNLVEENVKHVALLDVAEIAAIALQDDLNSKYGNKVKFYKCDSTKEDRLVEVFKDVVKSQGSIDILINNAGILNDSLEKYKLAIELNVTAVITGTLRGLQLMRRDEGGKGGVIVNVSSVAALTQSHFTPIYNATKSAVLQFSNCIGMEDWYKKTDVRVIAVCFGVTETPFIQDVCCIDKDVGQSLMEMAEMVPKQKPKPAADGVVEVLKKGESGSTWLMNADKPALDITKLVQKAHEILTEPVMNP